MGKDIRNLCRCRVSLRSLFVLVTLVAFAVLVIGNALQREYSRQNANAIRRGLREIMLGLWEYEHAHGALPFSSAGATNALNAIQSHIDVREQAALSTGALAYLNEQDSRADSRRIVLAQKASEHGNYVVTGDGIVTYCCNTAPPDGIVGCWLTIEGFIITSKDVFDEWCRTHPIDGPVQLEGNDSDCNPDYAVFPDRSRIDYTYAQGLISRCVVTTAGGRRTIEVVETDRYGQIVGVSHIQQE